MCRIAGILNYQSPPTKESIVVMRDAMQRGGPDDSGIYLDADLPLALGHRRLSLIDLSQLGHQPMMDLEEKIIIVYNGEIYNFQHVKNELLHKGYSFKSTSDTEVIIYAYKEWGNDCFSKFNGMFALALFDKIKNKLILARDHAGIKPLYYCITKHSLYFASEIRAFKQVDANWEENKDWKKYFLLFGHLPEPITTLQNVQSLPKGNLLEIDVTTLAIKQTSFFTAQYNYTITNEKEAVEKVHHTLNNAVQRHLISDAPIGLFLSGGIDSSLLTILAKPFVGDNLHTLSIVFDDEKYSEKQYQDIIIKQTKAHHQSYIVKEAEFINSLPDIMQAMDQPSTDGINSYFISKYAKQYGLTAVLSGLGADELFGGYQSFNRTNTLSKINWLPSFVFGLANFFPDDKRKKISFLQFKKIIGEYLFNRGFFLPKQVAQILDCTEEEVNDLLVNFTMPEFVAQLEATEKVSYFETNLYMQNQLLKDTDYMSMWHSLEVRVPFLDKELMQLVHSIYPAIRYSNNQIKSLLIKAFKNQLPEQIWNRPKQGFVFPFDNWMKKIQPIAAQQSNKFKQMHQQLVSGNLHWSRYWCYLLSQQSVQPFI